MVTVKVVLLYLSVFAFLNGAAYAKHSTQWIALGLALLVLAELALR